jgi:hypothetical protein
VLPVSDRPATHEGATVIPKGKADLRFIIHAARATYSADTFEVRLAIVHMTDEGVRNFSYTGDRYDQPTLAAYDGLSLGAHLSSDSPTFYGQEVGYRENYSTIDLPRAESMTKTLRRITRQMDGLRDRLGYPTDFAAAAGHLALAIGATESRCFGVMERAARGFYDSAEWRWLDVDGLRKHVVEQVNAWHPGLLVAA